MNIPPHNAFSPQANRISIIALILAIFLLSGTASGTWKLIAQFPATVNASFFFNEQHGLIGIDGVNGIKRTFDGGNTWLNSTIPSGFTGFVTDIFMKDSLNGWATIEEGVNNPAAGIWSTSDGGQTWQTNSMFGQFSAVYQTPNSLTVASRWGSTEIYRYVDNGAVFLQTGTGAFTGINYVDDLHGVASIYTGASAMYTNDGGFTWKTALGLSLEAWSVYAQKGTANFFAAGELAQSNSSSFETVYSSTDYGATWQAVGIIGERTTGHIAGAGSVIYVQCSPNGLGGLFRSIDGGRTWNSVGGPSNFRDTRFSVLGCAGQTVYAFDENGGVWKTTDGGDGQIIALSSLPVISPDSIFLSSTPCTSLTSVLNCSNFACSSLRIDAIGFSDSTAPIVTTGALSFKSLPKLPKTFVASSSDSIVLKWDARKMGVKAQLAKTFIRIRGIMAGSGASFDTLVPINTEVIAPQPGSRPDSIVFPSMKIGSQICTTFVLRNTAWFGQEPFVLESVALSTPDSAFRIPNFSALPLTLGGRDTVSLQVCFIANDTMVHRDSLLIQTDCFSFVIPIVGRGSTGLIFADDLDFGSVSIGDTVCKNILIKNIGTSDFILESSSVLSDFRSFSANTGSLPLLIKAGDSVPVEICFHPESPGAVFDSLQWITDLELAFAHSVKSTSTISGNAVKSGVKSSLVSSPLALHPNPTQNELSIELSEDKAHSPTIEIFDALGKKVFSEERPSHAGQNEIRIDTRLLPAGIYLLRIGDASQSFVKE